MADEEDEGGVEEVSFGVQGADGGDKGVPAETQHRRTPMAPALIALSPDGSSVVLAIGAVLRVFNLQSNAAVLLRDDTTPARHGDAIRAMAFDGRGMRFVSAGDDKLVKLWTHEWQCQRSLRVPKKVSAAAFSFDGMWLTFADKYGIVYVVATENGKSTPVQLLGHCCSIITDLALSANSKYIASADRDFKVRVSVFPENPLSGAHEIESFCLGHTLFVTCVAFIGFNEREPEGLLLSGGGDGTVRLWEPTTGRELQCVPVQPEGEHLQTKSLSGGAAALEQEAENKQAVMALAVGFDNRSIAVSVERVAGVFLLAVDLSAKTLQLLQMVPFAERWPPTRLQFDPHGRLWLAAGAVQVVGSDDAVVTPQALAETEVRAHEIASKAAVRIAVLIPKGEERTPSAGVALSPAIPLSEDAASGESKETADRREDEGKKAVGGDVTVLMDENIPGGEELLRALQGSAGEEALAAMAAEAAELTIKNELCKRSFSREERDFRKRHRNDRRGHAAAR